MSTSNRSKPATVLFCGLSIFNEIGGIQQFNQRLISATLNKANGPTSPAVGKFIVLSLSDAAAPALLDNITFIGCAGKRWRYIYEFTRAMLRDRPAAVLLGHINLALLAIITRLLAPRAIIALVVHGVEVWNDPHYRLRRWYETWLLKRCVDRVISVSEFTARVMKWQFQLDNMPFELLPNGVDLIPQKGRDSPSTERKRDSFSILSVARLADLTKGIDTVIEAVAILRSAIPNIEYHVVGDGQVKPDLIAQTRRLGVEKLVHFHGEISDKDLDAIYRNADVFVLPSRKEGFGIVFLEAWNYVLPIICSGVDASPEVVVDGNSGIIVDPNNAAGLAATINRLFLHPERRARLGKNGFLRLSRNFTNTAFVDRYQRILANLIAQHDGVRAQSNPAE